MKIKQKRLRPPFGISFAECPPITYASVLVKRKGALGHASLLVIDDEKLIADLLQGGLTASGYEVETALGGHEGLRLFENGFFDLVITDYRMPDMDGNGVATYIHNSDKPDTPIIGISGLPRFFQRHHFDWVLSKPFTLQNLADAVDNLMTRTAIHRKVSQAMAVSR